MPMRLAQRKIQRMLAQTQSNSVQHTTQKQLQDLNTPTGLATASCCMRNASVRVPVRGSLKPTKATTQPLPAMHQCCGTMNSLKPFCSLN